MGGAIVEPARRGRKCAASASAATPEGEERLAGRELVDLRLHDEHFTGDDGMKILFAVREVLGAAGVKGVLPPPFAVGWVVDLGVVVQGDALTCRVARPVARVHNHELPCRTGKEERLDSGLQFEWFTPERLAGIQVEGDDSGALEIDQVGVVPSPCHPFCLAARDRVASVSVV